MEAKDMHRSVRCALAVLILFVLASMPCLAGVEKLLGKWVQTSHSNDRLLVRQNGSSYEILEMNRDKCVGQYPATYSGGFLTGGAARITLHYDEGSGCLIYNSILSSSTSYRRITPALAKTLAADDAAYYKKVDAERRATQRKSAREAAAIKRAQAEYAKQASLDTIFTQTVGNLAKLKSVLAARPKLLDTEYTDTLLVYHHDYKVTLLDKAVDGGYDGRGYVDVVKYLLSKGANPNHADGTGATTLFRAVDSDGVIIHESHRDLKDSVRVELVQLLVSHGAKINARLVQRASGRITFRGDGNPGFTPVMIAVYQENLAVAKCLLELGADVSDGRALALLPPDSGVTRMVHGSVPGELRTLIEEYMSGHGASVAGAIGATKVVATVNGEQITYGQFAACQLAWDGPGVLDQMVSYLIVEQAGRKAGIDVTSAQIAGEMARVWGQDVKKIMTRAGQTLAGLRAAVRRDLILSELARSTGRRQDELHSEYQKAATVDIAPSAFDPNNGQPNATVATVNGEVITRDQLVKTLFDWAARRVLDKMISYRVIAQEAKKEGIVIGDKDVQAGIDEIKKMLPPGRDLAEHWKSMGMTPDGANAYMRNNLQVWALIEKSFKITPQDVAESHKVSQILVQISQADDPGLKVRCEADAKGKIESIAAEIKGGLSFEDAAKKYSDDRRNKDNGGDIGFFTKDQMPPEFSAAVAPMKPGEISAPVKTSHSYYLIKFVMSGKDATSGERKSAEDQIRSREIGARYNEFISTSRSKAKVVDTLGVK